MLTRLLIRLRRPMAVLTAIALVVMIASAWIAAEIHIPFGARTPSLGVGIFPDALVFSWVDGRWVDWIWIGREENLDWRWWNWLDTGAQTKRADLLLRLVQVPLWAVAAPSTLVLAAGIWAQRRQVQFGSCTACGYPLLNAAICPECGRAAPRAA